MTKPTPAELERLWTRHDAAWRDPAQVASQWADAAAVDAKLLRARFSGSFWDVLAELDATLLVTREYEHLVAAFSAADGSRRSTFMPLPHPSGLAIDHERALVHLASTRNPNQVFDLAPADGEARPLVPVRSRFLPGALYLHELALVGGELHANAVGHNAVVRLPAAGGYEHVWWPRVVDTPTGPDTRRNYIQLNSIAAGASLADSYFSASSDTVSARRPGHRNYPVDRRGVVFSGRTREVVARGLTRPHSARLRDGAVWIDNSGYGEVGPIVDGRFEPLARLPGWTRGLRLLGRVVFVGVSRVIPRFRTYAPGLDVRRSLCGVFALDASSGDVLGSCTWAYGNQVFAVEVVPRALTEGLPFPATGRRSRAAAVRLFSGFRTNTGLSSGGSR
jgi:uncharacterized protein (TIGR03032 family)